MPDRRGADLSISIKVAATGTISTLRLADQATPLVAYGELKQSALEEHRETLKIDLERMKSTLGETLDQGENWPLIDQAFETLRKRSNLLLRDLFGRDQVVEVQKLLSKAFAPARASDRFAFVEVTAPDFDTAPLEFLRIRHELRPTKIEGKDSLIATAREFVGFSAIVKRNLLGTSVFDECVPIIENNPRLPLKFFWDSGLDGAKSEWDFFKKYSAVFDVDGPWPDCELSSEEANRTVAKHLWDPQLKFDGTTRACQDEILHFACHFYVEQISENSFFRFGSGGSTARATIADIDSQLIELAMSQPRQPGTRLPLVFANACGSSVIRPSGLSSLPALILRNKNIGYIGTETKIPDEAAHEFSEEFYRQLLKRESLGDAITKARLHLIARYHNPLGILYTQYADPDIRVRKSYELAGDANGRE